MVKDKDLEDITASFFNKHGTFLKKLLSILWFPLAIMIFTSSYYMFLYDDSNFSVNDIKYDYPFSNKNIEISIEDKLMQICDSVDKNLVYYSWHLMIIFILGDLILWLRQFLKLSDRSSKIYKDIYDGLCSARTTCCLLLVIYIIFIFGKT